MTAYRGVFWHPDDARLERFSARRIHDGDTLVMVRLRVLDPFRVANILEALGDIRAEQLGLHRPPPARLIDSTGLYADDTTQSSYQAGGS